MTPFDVVLVFVLFNIKHFIIDFLLQKPYQYLNKGKYGHPGGILHAALHGVGTIGVLLVAPGVSTVAALVLALADTLVHYHVDWGKVNINNHFGWKPDNSEYYWWLLGMDQLLHQLTYIAIMGYIVLN